MNEEVTARLPAGTWNAHVFQWFNTVSFSIALGAPMILFFKGLGASATMLGVVASLTPLLTTLQIPAANYVERVGYRTFVLRGWAIRSVFILGMVGVALLPGSLSPGWRMGLCLVLLAAFATVRGFSTCGYLPWITQLVPEDVRGRFVARDHLASALAALATMVALAWWLGAAPARYGFAAAFAASFLAALASLVFLRRIPDAPVLTRPRSGRTGVPWLAMLRHPPFLRLVTYNIVVFIALAGASVFWVPLLRDRFGVPDGQMLWFAAIGCSAMV
ncbi:hypothetical protein HQ590_06120, partial [bacterium]|nr:hypothetical protein [bacterium]